jgi:hypothetical protein
LIAPSANASSPNNSFLELIGILDLDIDF